MKLIKLTDDHYVVVDDSEITQACYVYKSHENVHGRGVFYLPADIDFVAFNKEAKDVSVITHSTQPLEEKQQAPTYTDNAVFINFNSQKVYDKIKPLSLQEVKELIGEMDVESDAEEWAWIYNQGENGKEYFKIAKEAYIAAYNQCLEDNEEYIKRATEWEIELETIDNRQPCDCSCHNNPNMVHFVACCNNGWIGKVTQKLKLK